MAERRGPRRLSDSLGRLGGELGPQTRLARIQFAWREAVGPTIAAEATPVSERDGTLVVSCSSAVWAQELDLMQTDLLARLNAELGEQIVRSARFRADGRHAGR